MDLRYIEFLRPGEHFYTRRAAPREVFAVDPPSNWSIHAGEHWTHVAPRGDDLPFQGWKVHVSATLPHATRALKIVARYCFAHRIAFKFTPSPMALRLKNAKQGSRTESGKFITLYPVGDDALDGVLTRLAQELSGLEGPYILTDLRWQDGPLYVRFGAWRLRDGAAPLSLVRPDGTSEPDVRVPRFVLPEWAPVPEILRGAVDAYWADRGDSLPFVIDEAIQFSNSGGVYRAFHKASGRRVVLKEARPHAGLDLAGDCAVNRLGREARFLERNGDLEGIPELVDRFTVWEHEFLAVEHVEGISLGDLVVSSASVMRLDASPETREIFSRRALRILQSLQATVTRVHKRGYSIGDVQPSNVLVGDDDSVTLIDFETATEREISGQVAVPGFAAPAILGRFDADRFAVARIGLALFYPMVTALDLCPALTSARLQFIARRFGPAVADRVLELSPTVREPIPGPSLGAWGEIVADRTEDAIRGIERGIRDSLDLEARWPVRGDVAQFAPWGALNVANGLAGVTLSMHRMTLEAGDVCKVLRARASAELGEAPLGLLDGLTGAVCALAQHDDLSLLEPWLVQLERTRFDDHDLTLRSGLAGIGLALLSVRDRTDRAHRHRCDSALTRLVQAVQARIRARQHTTIGDRAGLFSGASGVALLAVAIARAGRHHQHQLVACARRALELDLERCVRASADGSLQADDEFRVLPYLGTGSAGIAVAAAELERFAPGRGVPAEQRRALLNACASSVYAEANLIRGRAGILAAVVLADEEDLPMQRLDLVDAHLSGLSLDAIRRGAGLVFPGQEGLRLSTDWATGSSGIGTVLADLAEPRLRWLPVCDPGAMFGRA